MFFQPSTRTRLSFEAAMLRLGGGVVGFADPSVTRAGKGGFYEEGLKDTVKVVQTYSDVIAIRHYESGAAAKAAEYADIPVLNGGDGMNEHPTQCLLDLYTMWRSQGCLDGLTVALVGDLTIRPMRSLTLGLSHFDAKVYLVSPPEQRSNLNMKDRPKVRAKFSEVSSIDEVLSTVDVVYIVPIKNAPDISLAGRARGEVTPTLYRLTTEKLRGAKPNLSVLAPLPRTDELPQEVDELPCAQYYPQSYHGMIVRMALLAMVLDRDGLF
jgi:aspartate carbamoyltransferase catalytic subunit